MARLNILHIRDSSGLYGAERVILGLAKHIDPKRFKFFLVCLQDKQGSAFPLINEAKGMGIFVEVVNVKSVLDASAVRAVRDALRAHNIHILHTHDFKATLFGMLSSINLGIKRVATVHGSVKDSFKIRASLFLEEEIIRHCFDMVIAVADDIQCQLRDKGFHGNRLRLIKNGIDLSLFSAEHAMVSQSEEWSTNIDSKIFGVVGRLVPDKGHRYFLTALSRVRQQYPSVKALIVGAGPSRDQIAAEIRQLGLEEHVFLCGARADMASVYRQMSYLVIPSLREGLPYALLEALASKVPVVATAVGDIPRLIKHGDTGYLVPPGNVEELYKYMVALIRDTDMAVKLAEEGHRVVREGFSVERMVKQTEAVYEDLAG